MSLDRSLKGANALVRHRNVLSRAERITQLEGEGKWTDAKGVLGLPKVGHRKVETAKAVKAEATEAAAATGGAPAAAPAAGAKGAAPAAGAAAGGKAAAPAKGAAPAAGAKGAAGPAAKAAAPKKK